MKVKWTGTAIGDVKAIKTYISRDSPAYGRRFAQRIVDAAQSLDMLPLRGRPVPEANNENIRELLFGNYRIMYRIETSRVLIMTVIHGARDLSSMEPKPWDVV